MLVLPWIRRGTVGQRSRRQILREHRAVQRERLDLVLADEGGVRHAAGLLHHHRQQREVGGAEANLRARLELQRHPADEVDQFFRAVRRCRHEPGSGAIVRDARRMLHQLVEGHRLPAFRQSREDLADRHVDVELALLLELHDRHVGERLRDRADAPHRLGRREFVVLRARPPVSRRARDVGRLHDRHRHAVDVMGAHEFGHALVDELALRGQLRVAAIQRVQRRLLGVRRRVGGEHRRQRGKNPETANQLDHVDLHESATNRDAANRRGLPCRPDMHSFFSRPARRPPCSRDFGDPGEGRPSLPGIRTTGAATSRAGTAWGTRICCLRGMPVAGRFTNLGAPERDASQAQPG